MAYSTVTISGKLTNPAGNADRRPLTFVTNVDRITDAAGNVIMSGSATVHPDSTGSFTVALPATDDVRLTPSGFQWHVYGPSGIDFAFDLPATPATVDFSDLVPAPVAPLPEGNAADAAVSALLDNDASGTRSRLDVAYARKPDGIADGQLLEWDATTGRFLAVNPTGIAELAYAENVTATATNWSGAGGVGTSVNLPQCTITVPASARPVSINFGCTIRMTTLGVGSFFLGLYETTGGSNVNKCFDIRSLPATVTAGAGDVSFDKTWRLGPTVAERTFKLVGFCWTNAADDAAGTIINNPANPSYIGAVAR